LFGELLDEAEVAVAGVVDDDVQAAEVVVRLLDGGEGGVAVGDVELDRQQRFAVLLGEIGPWPPPCRRAPAPRSPTPCRIRVMSQ
jgi:hypothetical protein